MTTFANDEVVFGLTQEELAVFAKHLAGSRTIRFNPDETWTAQKELALRERVNDRLTELKAENALRNADPQTMLLKPLS